MTERTSLFASSRISLFSSSEDLFGLRDCELFTMSIGIFGLDKWGPPREKKTEHVSTHCVVKIVVGLCFPSAQYGTDPVKLFGSNAEREKTESSAVSSMAYSFSLLSLGPTTNGKKYELLPIQSNGGVC